MSIEIPHNVALFLNFCGVPYPDIDEDQVHELADRVREFADNVKETHGAAGNTIKDMGSVYSGYSYSQLLKVWAGMSNTHMAELDRGCRVVGTALDVTAEVIRAVKIAVFAELGAMAVSYGAALSASIASGGVTFALGEALRAAARKLCSVMEQMLLAYILSEVIGKAIEPLEHIIEKFVHGTLYDATRDLLGFPDTDPNETLHIEPEEVMRYAGVLDNLADDILQHAAKFADAANNLTFTMNDPVAPPSPSQAPVLGQRPAPTIPEQAALPAGNSAMNGSIPQDGSNGVVPASRPASVQTPAPSAPDARSPAANSAASAQPAAAAASSAPAGARASQGQSSPWAAPASAGAEASSRPAGMGPALGATSPVTDTPGEVPVTATAAPPADTAAGQSVSQSVPSAAQSGAGSSAGGSDDRSDSESMAGSSSAAESAPSDGDTGKPAAAPPRPAAGSGSPAGKGGAATAGSPRPSGRKARTRRDRRVAGTPWARKSRPADATADDKSGATPWTKEPVTDVDAKPEQKVFAPDGADHRGREAGEGAATGSGPNTEPGKELRTKGR